jgi:hypothetical protein
MESRSRSTVETVLGTLGLFLILVLGWAADRVSVTANTPRERIVQSFAALSITAVTAIGSFVDRWMPAPFDESADIFRASRDVRSGSRSRPIPAARQ